VVLASRTPGQIRIREQSGFYLREMLILRKDNLKTVVDIVTGSRNCVTNDKLFFEVKPITRYRSREFKLVKTHSPL
jgi:hypothetical protein